MVLYERFHHPEIALRLVKLCPFARSFKKLNKVNVQSTGETFLIKKDGYWLTHTRTSQTCSHFLCDRVLNETEKSINAS